MRSGKWTGLMISAAALMLSSHAHAIIFTNIIDDGDPAVTFVTGAVALNNNSLTTFSYGNNGFSTPGLKGVGGSPTPLATSAGFFNAGASDLNDNGLAVFTGFSFGGSGVFTGTAEPPSIMPARFCLSQTSTASPY